MRTTLLKTLALLLAAPLLANAAVHRADTLATYVGGGKQPPPTVVERHATSGDGNRIVFADTTDFTRQNADGSNEIFLWDRKTGYLQLTDLPPQAESGVTALVVDRKGETVVMASRMDPTATNASTVELYRWTRTDGWTRLTFTPGPSIEISPPGLAVSDDGRRIALTSRGDYTGENPDNEQQVFVWTEGQGMQQVTHPDECGLGDSRSRDISGNGQRVLLTSACRFGELNTVLRTQLFLWDADAGLRALTQHKQGVTAVASLNYAGRKAAVVGENLRDDAPPLTHLYRWREGKGFERLTDFPVQGVQPAMSGRGHRIAYVASNGQGGRANPDRNKEVFLWENGRGGGISQLTDNPQGEDLKGCSQPSLSAAGDRLSVTAEADFAGAADPRRGIFSIEIIGRGPKYPNLLVGGNFDTGLRGWDPQPGATHIHDDARLQKASGAAVVFNQAGSRSTEIGPLSQCVAVHPNTLYAVTAYSRLFTSHASGSANIRISLHTTRGCLDQGLPVGDGGSRSTDDGYWVGSSQRFVTRADTRTVRIVLTAAKSTGEAVDAGFDYVRLRPVN